MINAAALCLQRAEMWKESAKKDRHELVAQAFRYKESEARACAAAIQKAQEDSFLVLEIMRKACSKSGPLDNPTHAVVLQNIRDQGYDVVKKP